MSSPSGLTIKNSLDNMVIGDCIPCRYTASSGVAGTFSELGTCTASEIPVIGSATPDGLFYFNKVDKGILVADRVIQHSISWDTLNKGKLIEGKLISSIPISVSAYSSTLSSSLNNQTSLLKIFNEKYRDQNNWYNTAPTTVRDYIQFSYNSPILINLLGINASTNTGGLEPIKGFTLTASESGTFSDEVSILVETYTNLGSIQIFKSINTIKYSYYRLYVDSWYEYNGLDGQNIYGIYPYCYIVRSLSGGNAYLGTDGKASLTDCNLGVWPINNEWDKYIVNSSLKGKITPGDDNVWHWGNIVSLCQDTPINGFIRGDNPIANNWCRVSRSYNIAAEKVHPWFNNSSETMSILGFRPVLEYIEPTSKASTLYY